MHYKYKTVKGEAQESWKSELQENMNNHEWGYVLLVSIRPPTQLIIGQKYSARGAT